MLVSTQLPTQSNHPGCGSGVMNGGLVVMGGGGCSLAAGYHYGGGGGINNSNMICVGGSGVGVEPVQVTNYV